MSGLWRPRILLALDDALDLELRLLDAVDDELWSTSVDIAMDATLGQHFRHCLEHFQPPVHSSDGWVDYDARPRDRRVEKDRAHARRHLRSLMESASEIPARDLSRGVRVRCRVSNHPGPSGEVESTLGRELMYAMAHAIHHHALMAVMCRSLGVDLPEGLGMAPSTVAHRGG